MTAVYSLALSALLVAQSSTAAVFNGTGAGDIPDSASLGPAGWGTPLVISFNVSGLQTNIQTVSVSITMQHQWVGDLDVKLTSPTGTNFTIFSRVGSLPFDGFGPWADLNGTYIFTDFATNTVRSFADSMGLNFANGDDDNTNAIAAGRYLPSAPGPTNEPATSFKSNSRFVGLTPAKANGPWILTVRDGAAGSAGTVQSAKLYLNESAGFSSITASNGVILLGMAGSSNLSYTLWRSADLAMPASSWEWIGDGIFGGNGRATNSTAAAAGSSFYRVTVP